MQMMMNAHADNSEEKQDDKEHDKDFKEVYGNLGKRSEDLFTPIESERESEKDQRTIKIIKEQECIPVGCVPPAH